LQDRIGDSVDFVDRGIPDAEAGYRDADLIRTDAALDPTHSHPDFRRLLMDLAMPADPFTGVD
jgi:hypothetical protein